MDKNISFNLKHLEWIREILKLKQLRIYLVKLVVVLQKKGKSPSDAAIADYMTKYIAGHFALFQVN